jgi:hypothetical protein
MWPELVWRRQYWSRRRSLFGLALVPPILMLLPLQRLFPGWGDGARAVSIVSAILLGMTIGKEATSSRKVFVWLYQKGISIPDHMLRSWFVDMGVGVCVIAVWTLAWIAGAAIQSTPSVSGTGGIFISSVAAMGIVAGLLFPIGAFNASRGSDAAGLLVLISLLQPVIQASGMSAIARALFRVVLPPMFDAVQLNQSLLTQSWGGLVNETIRIVVFLTVMLALGLWRFGRWTGASD